MGKGGPKMKTIQITTEYITLGQFLKLVDVVNSGGEAKQLILSGQVEVNGEAETRRGRKLFAGDIVRYAQTEYQVQK